MGYEVHIMRKVDYDDYDEASNITFEEVLSFVEQHSEFSWTDNAGHKDEGHQFFYWINYPELENNNSPWLMVYKNDDGKCELNTKWTDVTCLRKWLEMAEYFGGQLRGDDGERYDKEAIDAYEKQITASSTPNIVIKKKPFWKFW
jgi:hypothetical protein